MEKVKQICYSDWSDGPRQYWEDVDSIATFIAARLSYNISTVNAQRHELRISTISVGQHKEKFGQVRVYCDLAYGPLIVEKYRLASVDNIPIVLFEDCLLEDAKHYRKTYLSMVKLVPQYESIILSGADMGELLYPNIDELEKYLNKHKNEFLCSIYRKQNKEELLTFFKEVYK